MFHVVIFIIFLPCNFVQIPSCSSLLIEQPELLDSREFEPEKFEIEQLSPDEMLRFPFGTRSGDLFCLFVFEGWLLARVSLESLSFSLFIAGLSSDKTILF